MDLKVSSTGAISLTEINRVKEVENSEEFSFALNKVDDNGLMGRLNTLIDEITVQGKKLSEHMDIHDLKKYKGLVKDFINEVVTHSHQFSRENFLDRRGRHRVYGIVKLVDKGLDDLAQELLKSEKDNLKILDKTDEIRGLLLDILI